MNDEKRKKLLNTYSIYGATKPLFGVNIKHNIFPV